MQKIRHYIGIDVGSEELAVSIYTAPQEPILTKEVVPNTFDGFEELLSWFKEHCVYPKDSVICMEATGVYAESLCHFLVSQGFRVAVEPPLKVKRTFNPEGHKTDPVDSQQIAEYAYRFQDELRFWNPPQEVLENIRQLLTAREQFTKQQTALKNSLQSFEREVVKTPLVIKTHQSTLEELKTHIRAIDKEIQRLINQDPTFRQRIQNLKSIPGVGLLLAANILVITEGFTRLLDFRQLAAYAGICPYKHRSGTSVYRKDRSTGLGPPVLRKLLHLAARSVSTHQKTFRLYYLRKLDEGKAKRLVLNNISNKLIKLICVLIRSDVPYIANHKSVNPMFVQC